MDRRLEVPEPVHVRALVVGSSPWLHQAATELAADSVVVDGPLPPAADLETGRLEATDCLLTDEREVLSSVGDACPIVYALDQLNAIPLEQLRTDGATDVVRKTLPVESSMLTHRIRQAATLDATRQTIQRQRRWYRALIEQSSDLIVVADSNGTITYVEPSVERVGGYDAGSLRGSHITDAVHSEDVDTVKATFDELCDASHGTTKRLTYRCRHANGAWYVHEADLTNRLEDDDIRGIVASIRDITAFHQAEQELDEAMERVGDAFYTLDSEWRFTHINDHAAALFDVDPESVLGDKITDLFPNVLGTAFESAAIKAMETREPVSIERYYEPMDTWYSARIYPSSSGIAVYFTDVTERIERERALRERTERLEMLAQNLPVILFVHETDGTILLAEGRGLEKVDQLSDDVVGESIFEIFSDHSTILSDTDAAIGGDQSHSQIRLDDRVFESWWRPVTDEGAVERVIGIAVDVTERAQYQEALNALHEATNHLLTVESKQAACEYMVDVASDVLDIESVVYRFDDHHNELVPAAYSHAFETNFGRPEEHTPDDGLVWQTFVEGTSTLIDDLTDTDGTHPDRARSGLYVPIGEHGVLVAFETETNHYDDETYELAQLFATTAEAALDRISRTRRLHGRERTLKRQNIHLEQLNEANSVRQDIEQLLLMADERAEIERGICERLAAHEECSFVWFGEPDPGGHQLEPRASAGRERAYLEELSVTTVDDSAAEPAGRTARTRTSSYVENVADSVRDGTWRVEALSRNYQSVYAVPIVYDDFLYGVVSIYGDDRDAFDEPLRDTLAELGETIAYAITAVKRKSALADSGVDTVELEIELTGDSLFRRLAGALETQLTFEGATIRDDGGPTVFAVANSDAVTEHSSDLRSLEGVHDVSIIAESEDETLLQLQCSEPFLGSVVDTDGGTLRTFVAADDETRATIEVPESVEVRELLSGLNRRGFSASMVARREQSTTQPTIDVAARNALLAELTDRQQEVVQTAYHGGYFEWPRHTNGDELADSLEISPPAFHKHVRAVEQKLFATIFDETVSEG